MYSPYTCTISYACTHTQFLRSDLLHALNLLHLLLLPLPQSSTLPCPLTLLISPFPPLPFLPPLLLESPLTSLTPLPSPLFLLYPLPPLFPLVPLLPLSPLPLLPAPLPFSRQLHNKLKTRVNFILCAHTFTCQMHRVHIYVLVIVDGLTLYLQYNYMYMCDNSQKCTGNSTCVNTCLLSYMTLYLLLDVCCHT